MISIFRSTPRNPSPAARRLRAAAGVAATYALAMALLSGWLFTLHLNHVVLVDPFSGDGLLHALGFHGCAALAAGAAWSRARSGLVRSEWPGRVMFALLPVLAVASCDRWMLVFFAPLPERKDPLIVPHPVRMWTLAAGYTLPLNWGGDTINERGLRGPLVPVSPSAGERRVILAGDSVAFGSEVPWPETLAAEIVTLSRASASKTPWTVVNLGVPGYAPWQELDILKEKGMKYAPDVIVYVFCLNDVTDRLRCEALRDAPRTNWQKRLEGSGLFRFGRWVSARLSPIDARIWYESLADRHLIGDADSPWLAQAWERYLEDVDALAEFVLAREAEFVILLVPCAPHVRPDARTEDLPQRRLAAHAETRGYAVVDLLPVLRDEAGFDDGGSSKAFVDLWHLSPVGHQLAARELIHVLDTLEQQVTGGPD